MIVSKTMPKNKTFKTSNFQQNANKIKNTPNVSKDFKNYRKQLQYFLPSKATNI